MEIEDDIVAVVSPRKLQVFSFRPDEHEALTRRHLRSIEL